MEEKLTAYRRKKFKEQFWNTITLRKFMDKPKDQVTVDVQSLITDSPASSPCSSPTPEDNISIASSNLSFNISEVPRFKLVTYVLYVALWTTLLLIAIQLRFGAVFLVISGIIGIYLNTRTGPKKEGELSAYSVFNPKCEAIDGTLKAEHFERQFNLIQHSPAS